VKGKLRILLKPAVRYVKLDKYTLCN